VLFNKSASDNFGVKAAQIADRKFIRIALIRMNLRSLAVDDFSELSRSKLLQELLLKSTSMGEVIRNPWFSFKKSDYKLFFLRNSPFQW